MFGGNFAPRGWAFCAGQIISIAQNTALFALVGTTYGGNGQTTFALPDLRGRVPIGQGNGPGLPPVDLGEVAGQESVTLINTEIPAHNHTVSLGASNIDGNPAAVKSPANAVAGYSDSAPLYAPTGNTTMLPFNSGITGGNQPHTNLQPYLALNYIIAMEGIFPSRN